MNRIQHFESDAIHCVESVVWTSKEFGFSDFSLQSSENTLSFKWTSAVTQKVCSITYIASDDYPENCYLQQQWGESEGQVSCVSCCVLPELLTDICTDLKLQEQQTVKTEESPEERDVGLTKVDHGGEDNSDLEYTDCESRLSSEEDDDEGDNFDFDPVEFYEAMNKPKPGENVTGFSEMDMISPLLRQDIQFFQEIFTTPDLPTLASRDKKRHASQTEDKKRASPDLKLRLLETLGEVDCDIHVPLNTMNLAPQLASAWKFHLDEPLVVRLNFNCQNYLDYPEPPKVDVFQPNKKECGIALQMKNILTLFLKEQWNGTDNQVLRSKLKRSGSVPTYLSTAAGAASTGSEGDHQDRSKQLQHLMEMGFGETESRNALRISNNSLMEASNILAATCLDADLSDMSVPGGGATVPVADSSVDPPYPPTPCGGRSDAKTLKKVKRILSSPGKAAGKKREPPARSLSSSVTEPNLTGASGSHWTFPTLSTDDVKRAPSLADGFIVMMYRYIRQRVPRVNEFCVVCDCSHVFQANGAMLMPSVCSRELCLFAFQTLGVMANATADIATGAEVVDLLITMAKAACLSLRQATIFTPFPSIVDPNNPGCLALSDKKKDFKKVTSLLQFLPSMEALTSSSCSNLHKDLDQKDALLYPLLSWIIYSNRSHIVKLPPEKQLKCMATPHQFLLLSSPPAQEKLFQELKAQYGSCFAFHGSSIENWHAIIRQGLIVASGTKFQMNGAAHGKGIYLSPTSTYSFVYSRMGHHQHHLTAAQKKQGAFKHRFLNSSTVNCIALCEVIQSPELVKKNNDIWVVTNESHVCTRFFFVYEDGQVGDMAVNMTKDFYRRMVEEALSKCFMAVVPDCPPANPPGSQDS